MIYADGMLTPAISVLSAVEGLSVSAPMLAHWAVPVSVVILAGLFAIQRHRHGKGGRALRSGGAVVVSDARVVRSARAVGPSAGAVGAESGGGSAVSRS